MIELTLPVIVTITALVGGGIGAAVQGLVGRKPATITAQAATMTAEALAQGRLNEGFAALVAALTGQVTEARAEIAACRSEAKATHDELMGEIENLSQHVYSLENILRQKGEPIPIRQRPAVYTMVPKSQ